MARLSIAYSNIYIFIEYERAEHNHREHYVNCRREQKTEGKSCLFSKKDLGPCGESDYGYDEGKPCIYFRLNKLIGWEPDSYTAEDIGDDIPQHIADRIKNTTRVTIY